MEGLRQWWRRAFGRPHGQFRRARWRMPVTSAMPASATIFLILRRMRAPLITLIVIFAVSVFGLTLIPGQDAAGRPWRMGFFDAFYFMSYTATTIGFGEIPHAFTAAQRLWVMITIYLTVIGWAYAIGSVLTLLQDRAFRQALALQRLTRKVVRLREPFLLIAGYGQTGRLLGRAFDNLGRRFVVIDAAAARIDDLDLESYHSDVPGLVGDAGNPHHLGVAGLGHPLCEAVLALTDSDEVNLAITMTATLLRPELPVIARTTSPAIAHRMLAFGTPIVINPFDRFGDHLRLALRAPASYQLMSWLANGPGADLPPRGRPPTAGRWVVCGYGRFGRELAADLRAEGSHVTVIDPAGGPEHDASMVVGDASDPSVMARAEVEHAVGFVAATDNDTTNLSLIAGARRINPSLFVASRQNHAGSAALFAAMNVDSLLVPSELVAHEVYAQLSTPLLWRFLQQIPAHSDDWAAHVVERVAGRCGHRLGALWKMALSQRDAPALWGWITGGDARLRDLLRSPEDRAQSMHTVVLMVQRDNTSVLTPDDDFVLAPGDQLLLTGRPAARRSLEAMVTAEATVEYVVFGRRTPASWIWRQLTGHRSGPARSGATTFRPR